MIYEIEPLDNYFFRSPVPFEAGGDTTILHSIFPPLPSVYAGAFRKLTEDGQRRPGSIKIGLNGIMWDGIFCYPMPEDLYISKKKYDRTWDVKTKSLVKRTWSNYPLGYMMGIREEAGKKKDQIIPYMRTDAMRSYLMADRESFPCMNMNEKLVKEAKMGIAIDSVSGAAKDQQIYMTLGIRPVEKLKLAADVQADLVKDQGIIKLGGEGKLAAYGKADNQEDIGSITGNSRYFKLYLASPAIFRHGWIPGWLNPHSFEGYFSHRKRSVRLKLISACVGRSVLCGGFGRKIVGGKRQYLPREMRYAVPAGSVYYFELLNGTFEDAVKLFHKKCISDYREGMGFDYQVYTKSRYCDRGFGYSMVGRLNKDQEDFLNVQ